MKKFILFLVFCILMVNVFSRSSFNYELISVILRDISGESANVGANGGLDVNIQDQTTPPVDLYFTRQVDIETALSVDSFIGQTSVTVASDSSLDVGDTVIIASGVSLEGRFYFGEILALPGGNIVELDTPLDFAFESGDPLAPLSKELNVDGSPVSITSGTLEFAREYVITNYVAGDDFTNVGALVNQTGERFVATGVTPTTWTNSSQLESDFITFEIRGAGVGSPITIDITRLLMQCQTDSAVDLSTFGDIAGGLTRGIVIRRNNGFVNNVFNAKTNGELANLAYDWSPLTSSNPAFGVDGFVWRYTFAGQEKHGVAVRLAPGDSLQLLIQGDLSTIDLLRIIGAGHIVQPN